MHIIFGAVEFRLKLNQFQIKIPYIFKYCFMIITYKTEI